MSMWAPFSIRASAHAPGVQRCIYLSLHSDGPSLLTDELYGRARRMSSEYDEPSPSTDELMQGPLTLVSPFP